MTSGPISSRPTRLTAFGSRNPPFRGTPMSRVSRIAIFAVLAAIFFGGPSLVRFYTDWLWFGEVGYQFVYATMLRSQGTLFTMTFVAALIWLAVNLRAAIATIGDLRPVFTTREG